MFGKMFDSVVSTATDFVNDPAGTTLNIATQPVADALDLIDGLSEGELREKAALRLGTDIAGGMAVSELVDWYVDL